MWILQVQINQTTIWSGASRDMFQGKMDDIIKICQMYLA